MEGEGGETRHEEGGVTPRAGRKQRGLAPCCHTIAGGSGVSELVWGKKGFELCPEVPASMPSPYLGSVLYS